MSAAQKDEEQRLAALKAELAQKKQAAPASAGGSLAATIAEIKRLNAEIEGIEAAFAKELTAGKGRITARYDAEIAALQLASKQKQVPLQRDEFETETEYKTRVARQNSSYSDRIAELERKRLGEISELEGRLKKEQQSQTADLRTSLKQLADRQFTVGAESITVELGTYNPDKQFFPVTLRSTVPYIKVAMNGEFPLPRDSARRFKQEYSSGLVRPLVVLQAGSGDVARASFVNDADNGIYEYMDGEFITVAERKRREAKAVEFYTDRSTGLMWVRNGSLTGKKMNWDEAIVWVKNLSYQGYSDWRLPTKDELEFFVKQAGKQPWIWFNSNGFKSVQADYYWSGSTNAYSTNDAWVVGMGTGLVYDGGYKSSNYYVWPVRSGQ